MIVAKLNPPIHRTGKTVLRKMDWREWSRRGSVSVSPLVAWRAGSALQR